MMVTMSTFHPDRRTFLKAAAAASAPLFVPGSVLANSPNGKLNHASIGTDGMGWSDLTSLATHDRLQVVAICDVDVSRMERAATRFPQARRYQDWRELLEAEADRIDSINVSVPDHMHAAISLSAIERGKHVYCQKPLTHDVAEARALRLAAERSGVVTQMGNQIQSHTDYRTAVEMVRQGMIGKVREIHAWAGARFPQRGRPAGEDPIPTLLDWDKWLGTAPVRPFKANVYHPFNWRGWQDFGGGAIADFGCHILDSPFKALGLTAPQSLRAEVPSEWAENEAWRCEHWPDWEIIHYQFPGTELTAGSTIDVIWYDGGKQPPRERFGIVASDREAPGSGALFIGEEGTLLLPHVGPPEILSRREAAERPQPRVDGFDHYHAFVNACLGKGKTHSSFTYAGPLAEATLLGTVAVRLPGQTLQWNAAELQITNSAEAHALLARHYRDGWQVPGLG
jgi:predicted dehydrogenase